MTQSEEAIASERTLEQFKTLLTRKYPKLAKDGINESSIALLPSGQLITLWMTLHHNFYEGCVQKLLENELSDQQRIFFTTIAEYFWEFLSAVKMLEISISIQTIEKMTNLLMKFGSECLAGLAASLVDRKHDEDIIHWFLKLCHAWSELQGLLLEYHWDKYTGVKPVIPGEAAATNLTYFLPFLTSEQWEGLEKQVNAFGQTCCREMFVDLVCQKLKYLTVLEQKRNNSGQDFSNVKAHIDEASFYIWSNLQKRSLGAIPIDMYPLVKRSIKASDTIEFTHEMFDQMLLEPYVTKYLPADSEFHSALVLEVTDNLLRKIVKMKILPKLLKQIRKEVFSIQNREKILNESVVAETPFSTEILQHYLCLTNHLLECIQGRHVDNTASFDGDDASEFSASLLLPYMNLLSSLPLEEYSKTLNTTVFLTMLNCIIAVAQHEDQHVLDLFVNIFRRSSANSVGNQFIFSVSWVQFFKWFYDNAGSFSSSATASVAHSIFENIYVSSNAVDGFSDNFQSLLKVKIKSTAAPIQLTLLGFLIRYLGNQKKLKETLSSQIRSHTEDLMRVVLKSLRKLQKSERNSINIAPVYKANVFHAAWLLTEAFQLMSVKAAVSVTDPKHFDLDFESLRSVVEYQKSEALLHLQEKVSKNDEPLEGGCQSDTSTVLGSRFALAFLKGICRTKEFQPEFIMKLWEVYMETPVVDVEVSEIPVLTASDIYIASTEEDFEKIAMLLSNELEIQANLVPQNEKKLAILAKHIGELLDVELTPEKKAIRRHAIEAILYACIPIFTVWNRSPSSITQVVLPFLQLFLNLARRRNALCSTNTLSLCLAAITSTPLNEINDIHMYRKVFCGVGDLLNSFAIHRIDVLSFRNHIYLQCFQTLLESVTLKADQKNNLTDEDIVHLKYCSHWVERICQSMKLGRKEFSRISPYCIAMMMRQFELFTVYPTVKEPLLSGCYKLIDLCDDHGTAQLNSMFTTGSREIFKTVYDVYKKFYRYTGKV